MKVKSKKPSQLYYDHVVHTYIEHGGVNSRALLQKLYFFIDDCYEIGCTALQTGKILKQISMVYISMQDWRKLALGNHREEPMKETVSWKN